MTTKEKFKKYLKDHDVEIVEIGTIAVLYVMGLGTGAMLTRKSMKRKYIPIEYVYAAVQREKMIQMLGSR